MTIFTSSFCEDVLVIGARLSMYIISPEYFLTSGFAFPRLNVWPRETFFPPTTIELWLLNDVSTIKFSGDDVASENGNYVSFAQAVKAKPNFDIPDANIKFDKPPFTA